MSALNRDHVFIRGRRLALDELVDPQLARQESARSLHEKLRTAQPFEHLVVDGLFNPLLLELVHEEFDVGPGRWQSMWGPHEKTRRTKPHPALGPASALYFGVVNSHWFLDWLSALSGVADLIADPGLSNGGLHETRAGGGFDVHRDFDRHAKHGFTNEMVFITYLNKGWDPAWHGALELWDGQAKSSVIAIPPTFGSSIVMRHGPASFHGHPTPLASPAERPRRSVATYYYTNRDAAEQRAARAPTAYLFPGHLDAAIRLAEQVTPPFVWRRLKTLVRG